MATLRKAHALLLSALFLVIAPGTLAGWIPWWISKWRLEPPLFGLYSLRILGGLLIVAGIPVLLDSFARFALQGLGTPAPIFPTRRLVVTGLYRCVRNPMYVAVLSVIAGQGLLFGNARLLAYATLVWAGFHVFVLAYEEPTLRRTYGHEYDAYCNSVPRWIPRLRPRR